MYLEKSREIILREGILCYGRKVASKCREVAYSTNAATWFCRGMVESVPPIQRAKHASVEICPDERIVSWLKEYHREFGWLYIPQEISLKDKEKHIYLAAVYDDRIVGYIKIAINRVYILDYDTILDLPPGAAMIYDTFVLPEYRRKGVCAALIREGLDDLRARGYKIVWCHIPRWNTASLRAYARAGFKKVAHVRFRKLLGYKLWSHNVRRMVCCTPSEAMKCGRSGNTSSGGDRRTVG